MCVMKRGYWLLLCVWPMILLCVLWNDGYYYYGRGVACVVTSPNEANDDINVIGRRMTCDDVTCIDIIIIVTVMTHYYYEYY